MCEKEGALEKGYLQPIGGQRGCVTPPSALRGYPARARLNRARCLQEWALERRLKQALVLLGLAFDAVARPGNGIQALHLYFFLALDAFAI